MLNSFLWACSSWDSSDSSMREKDHQIKHSCGNRPWQPGRPTRWFWQCWKLGQRLGQRLGRASSFWWRRFWRHWHGWTWWHGPSSCHGWNRRGACSTSNTRSFGSWPMGHPATHQSFWCPPGALAGGTGSGLGMPGLQGTGLDAQGDKGGFVKLSTDPETLHQAFHYADIAVTRLWMLFQCAVLFKFISIKKQLVAKFHCSD